MRRVQIAKTHKCPVCMKSTYGAIHYSAGQYAEFMCMECHGSFMGKINQKRGGLNVLLPTYDIDKHLTNPSRRDNAFPTKRFMNSTKYKKMGKK